MATPIFKYSLNEKIEQFNSDLKSLTTRPEFSGLAASLTPHSFQQFLTKNPPANALFDKFMTKQKSTLSSIEKSSNFINEFKASASNFIDNKYADKLAIATNKTKLLVDKLLDNPIGNVQFSELGKKILSSFSGLAKLVNKSVSR